MTTKIEIGDKVQAGQGEDHDVGEVLEIGGSEALVRWDGAMCTETHPVSRLAKRLGSYGLVWWPDSDVEGAWVAGVSTREERSALAAHFRTAALEVSESEDDEGRLFLWVRGAK